MPVKQWLSDFEERASVYEEQTPAAGERVPKQHRGMSAGGEQVSASGDGPSAF